MKLKKIASLMLAGVMAVSMLTACGSKTETKPEGEGNGDGTTVSGYSAKLESFMSDEVKDMDNVTFQDNASDASALQKSVGNVTAEELASLLLSSKITVENMYGWTTGGHKEMIDELIDAYDVKDNDIAADLRFASPWISDANSNRKLKDVELFAANGSIGMDETLNKIADLLNSDFEALPEKNDATGATATYNYDYVVSVSVVNKPVTGYTTYTGSVNYIAVTVTRTVSVD